MTYGTKDLTLTPRPPGIAGREGKTLPNNLERWQFTISMSHLKRWRYTNSCSILKDGNVPNKDGII